MASFILGVMGKKRHGKDTFASRLVDSHGFTRVAFADPLKAAATQLNPLIPVQADELGLVRELVGHNYGLVTVRLRPLVESLGWERAKELREARRILQELGVAIRDNVDPFAWVAAATRVADAVPGPVVITDVRFPNEVAAIRSYGGRGALVWIDNPRVADSGDSHISENAVTEFDADRVIFNGGTIAELHARADVFAADRLPALSAAS